MENWWSFPFFHGAVQSHSQASTTLAKSTLKSQNRRRTTLPEDFNYDPQNLRQLFLKPHVKVRIPRRIPGNRPRESFPAQTSPHQTLRMFWAFPRAALTTNTPGRAKRGRKGQGSAFSQEYFGMFSPRSTRARMQWEPWTARMELRVMTTTTPTTPSTSALPRRYSLGLGSSCWGKIHGQRIPEGRNQSCRALLVSSLDWIFPGVGKLWDFWSLQLPWLQPWPSSVGMSPNSTE